MPFRTQEESISMKTLDLVIRRLAPAALLATVLLAGGAARGDDGDFVDPNGSYDDGTAQMPDDSGGSWYAPPQDDSNGSLYQQGNGTGENYGDGSGSYGNANTGTGVITDGQGGVWVQPDPGGYTAPSE